MQLKNLFDDDAAVSPVIGVILMVAITVILAAVIGTFVLGLGDSIGENAPSASYDWDDDGENATLTHVSGQNIDAARVTGTIGGDAAVGEDNETLGEVWSGEEDDRITSGDSVEWVDEDPSGGQVSAGVEDSVSEGDELRVIWTASGGGSSSTLTTYSI